MNRLWFAVSLIALLTYPLPGQTPATLATPDAAKLKQLEQQWMEAVRQQDLKVIERLLAPEFTLTVALEGQPLEVTSRADYLEACKGFYVIHSFEFKEFLVRQYGNVAIVNARYVQKATLGGSQARSAEFFLSDTWVRRNGRWQVAARYSSRPEKP
jgi:ketosteroid isomerase-like protein